MKIGLVRHFKVNVEDFEDKYSIDEYNEWMKKYDIWDVTPTEVDLRGINWNKCYASELPRAVTTARTIYSGEIIKTPLIREVPMRFKADLPGKESIEDWGMYYMLDWARSGDLVVENLSESKERVVKFLDQLEKEVDEDDNILLVCHGVIMVVIGEELERRGFTGERALMAKNGELFLYEK